MTTPAAAAPAATGLDTEFKRGLGLFDSTMVVVGSMIGSGIFIVSADIARQVGSPGWLLMAWILACAAPALEAAPVAWSTSSISGPSDVLTTGTLVGALNAGQGSTAQTINGVVFAADPGGTSAIPLGTATLTLSMTW